MRNGNFQYTIYNYAYLQFRKIFLKLVKEDACLHSAERPFQDLAPLIEKHFCPFLEFFFCSLRSVDVFLRFLEFNLDFSVSTFR